MERLISKVECTLIYRDLSPVRSFSNRVINHIISKIKEKRAGDSTLEVLEGVKICAYLCWEKVGCR